VIDATDEASMVALGVGQFDAITCTMALMDVPTVAPIFRAVSQLLKDDGRFVYVTAHPAFNSNNPIFVHELIDTDGQVDHYYAVKLRDYLDVPPIKGAGARGEPNPHYYYHRPMHELLGIAFESGLVLDGLLEPAYPRDNAGKTERLIWDNLWQIPPVMTGRLRKR
jgi:SAM-dependent methyltransferase